MTIAEALEAERKLLGLSVYELAKRSGVDVNTLHRLLDGRTANPRLYDLRRALFALDQSLAWLEKRLTPVAAR